MAQEQSTHVAELELSVARLHQREKRLRAVLSSAFTSPESRLDAREELESLLDKTVAAEDELQLLDSPAGDGILHSENQQARSEFHHQPRMLLKRRFRMPGWIKSPA
jgi:hypothetical protein